MRHADLRGDAEEFAAALEANLAIVRFIDRQPLLIDRLVGDAIETMSYASAGKALAAHPEASWVEALEGAIKRQQTDISPRHAFEGERIANMDTVAWVFSDPANVRWGRRSPALKGLFGGLELPAGRLGSYRENREAVNAEYDQAEKVAGTVNSA
jgi:hypothetical protein